MTREDVDLLMRLSGMRRAQGYYTAEEWEEKTGINPKRFAPKYIGIRKSGLCVWEESAENVYQTERARVRSNWAALGV